MRLQFSAIPLDVRDSLRDSLSFWDQGFRELSNVNLMPDVFIIISTFVFHQVALLSCLKLNDSEITMGSWRVHPDFRGHRTGNEFANACRCIIMHNFGEPLKEYGAALYKLPTKQYFKSPSPGKLMREWVWIALSISYLSMHDFSLCLHNYNQTNSDY